MLVPFFGLDTVTILTTVFWIWMLVDCLFSKKPGGIKVGWFIFILLTHIVGAVIYFFVACSRQNPVDAFAYYLQYIKRAFQPETQAYAGQQAQWDPPQPQQAAPPLQPYSDYRQGYQAQDQHPEIDAQPVAQEVQMEQDHAGPQYEQPMVSYPEIPQQ
ncbi:MAG TPA: PLD nuclease N-terminal domain-containing protein [Ktedonobacteraceae bacterium]|jgi:hypothetical protein|nr:PLD nuclease N-terminal domain-containing protein [Ktedonobacteraceae bacterium]